MSEQHHFQALSHILDAMKKHHRHNEPATAALRRDRLMRSAALIRDNHAALTAAIGRDFGHRSGYQTQAADLITTINMLT